MSNNTLVFANLNLYLSAIISKTLKLTTALAQFLYTYKTLDIGGVGTFTLDPSIEIATTDHSRQQKTATVEGITFESNPSAKESPELVGFISTQTGKMKALAAADLNSHLELMQQFLNIGKPFLLEGIGSLVKLKTGVYEFTPGTILTEKLKEITSKSDDAPATPEEHFNTYEPFLKKEKIKAAWKKPLALLLVLAGIAFAVWGGYTIYKRNAEQKKVAESIPEEKEVVQPQTIAANASTVEPVESTQVEKPITPPGSYKFILETAVAKRAFERFNKLKTYNWPVKMETKDSVQFKLYMLLPATDTSRMLDSLSALNGRRVTIER